MEAVQIVSAVQILPDFMIHGDVSLLRGAAKMLHIYILVSRTSVKSLEATAGNQGEADIQNVY